MAGGTGDGQVCVRKHSQKTHHRVLEIITWLRCFTLYIAVMSKQRSDMVHCMVAHLHTVLKLHQKAPKVQHGWNMTYNFAWRWQLEKTVCRRRVTPWQYVSCLLAQTQTRTHLIWRRLLQHRRLGLKGHHFWHLPCHKPHGTSSDPRQGQETN